MITRGAILYAQRADHVTMKRTFYWSLDLLISGSDKLGGISENKNDRCFQLTAILLDILLDFNRTCYFISVRSWLNIQEHAYTH